MFELRLYLEGMRLRLHRGQRIALLSVIVTVLTCEVCALSNHAELYTSRSFTYFHSSSYPHFVMFFAPWCSHWEKLKPLWDKYAEESHKNRKMKIAKVDCSESTPLCSRESIKAYPTFRLFYGNKRYTFRGLRNIMDFEKFVKEHIPNLQSGQVTDPWGPSYENDHKSKDQGSSSNQFKRKGAKELSIDNFEDEIKKGFTFVDFFAPWCSHCQTLAPVWEKLADYFMDYDTITIAKVDCTAEPTLCSELKINAFPTLILYNKGEIATSYKLDRSLGALIDFIQKVLREFHEEKLVIKEELKHEPTIVDSHSRSIPTDSSDVPNLSVNILANIIQKHTVCAFFNNDLRFGSHMNEYHVFIGLYYHYLDEGNIKMFKVDCIQEKEFCEKYQVSSFPAFLCFYGGKSNVIYHEKYEKDFEVFAMLHFTEEINRKRLQMKDEL